MDVLEIDVISTAMRLGICLCWMVIGQSVLVLVISSDTPFA